MCAATPRTVAAWLGIAIGVATCPLSAAPEYVPIPATPFVSVLATSKDATPVALGAYAMRSEPVTQAEFLAFVQRHPQWRRDRVPSVFADTRYLARWQSPDRPGDAVPPLQAVTQVSWFAAQAYCQSEQARLPSWIEWERAAAASASVADARSDPRWRQQLLDWYARPSREIGTIGGAANLYGVRDLHALVWEWVEDFNALMVASDSRDQGDPDRLKFCGEAALSLRDRDNYALLMRVAMLSSLKAADTTMNLGFRCVRDTGTPP